MPTFKRTLLLGFLTWFVPLLASFALFSPEGKPVLDIMFTKSILLIIASANGAFWMLRWFARVDRSPILAGLVVGGTWLAINWGLDLLVLLPLSGETPTEWFCNTGLGYLIIPMMSISLGVVSTRSPKNHLRSPV